MHQYVHTSIIIPALCSQIVKTACSKTDRYRIDSDSLDEIKERMCITSRALKDITDSDSVFLYIVDAERNRLVHHMGPDAVAESKRPRITWPIRMYNFICFFFLQKCNAL